MGNAPHDGRTAALSPEAPLERRVRGEDRMKERNQEITRRVLNGETMTDLAKEYGVSAPRIRLIVACRCRKNNEAWFKTMPSFNERKPENGWGFDLAWIREHKRVFISTPNE